jgi:hypothetical protein
MLDQVLLAQASLSTIRVLTNVALISIMLLMAGGAGLVLTRRAASRFSATGRLVAKIAVGLGASAAGALIVVLGLAAFRRPERFEWTVHLQTEPPLQLFQQDRCATWGSGDDRHDECIYEGETSLTAQFPDGRFVVQTGRALWTSGRDGHLTSLHHVLQPMTVAGVRGTVEPLIDPWHLSRERFDDWLTRSATEERASYFTPAAEDRAAPWLELSIRPLDTTSGGERMFVVSVKWRWNDE